MKLTADDSIAEEGVVVASSAHSHHPVNLPLTINTPLLELNDIEGQLERLFQPNNMNRDILYVPPNPSQQQQSSQSVVSEPQHSRPSDILVYNEDTCSTAVSEFTTHTEGMTVSPASSYQKGEKNNNNTITPETSPDNSSRTGTSSEGEDSNLDEYRAEDLFKLLEAQQSITKCFSEIAMGMAGIIDRNERKKLARSSSLRRRGSSSRTGNDHSSVGSSVVSGRSNSGQSDSNNNNKADRVCHVVENMAVRQDELAVKVVGIAVNALTRANEAEQEREYLAMRVKQLEEYIESRRRKKKTSSSSSNRPSRSQSNNNNNAPRRSVSANGQQRSSGRRRHHHRRADGSDVKPPGFSGILDFSHTEIDICQISKNNNNNDNESVVPDVGDAGSVRFFM